MRLRCFYCGAIVSSEIPDGTVFRATAECPECTELTEEQRNAMVEARHKVDDDD